MVFACIMLVEYSFGAALWLFSARASVMITLLESRELNMTRLQINGQSLVRDDLIHSTHSVRGHKDHPTFPEPPLEVQYGI